MTKREASDHIRRQNVFLAYQPKYFSPYMIMVADAIKPETILYIEPFNTPLDLVTAEQVRLSDFPAKQYKNSRVFMFDYLSRPVSKIAQLLHAQGAEIVFIQHGSISHLTVEIQTGAKSIFWKRLWARLSITAQIALLAARTGQLPSLLSNTRKIDIGLLESAYIMLAEDAPLFEDLADRCVLCESVNSEKFCFDPRADSVFISQPLIEDGIVDSQSYLALFDNLIEKCQLGLMIAHPRDRILADHARRKGVLVASLKDQKSFAASKVFGHYSTLLYEIQGIDVIRLDYKNGEDIEQFRREYKEDMPIIVEALKDRFSS